MADEIQPLIAAVQPFVPGTGVFSQVTCYQGVLRDGAMVTWQCGHRDGQTGLHSEPEALACAQAELSRRQQVTLAEVTRNLASINEILMEVVDATAEPEFAEVVRAMLSGHSWRLGFAFQGQGAPAGRDAEEHNG